MNISFAKKYDVTIHVNSTLLPKKERFILNDELTDIRSKDTFSNNTVHLKGNFSNEYLGIIVQCYGNEQLFEKFLEQL
ncbi:MAG: hypothetical protein DI598_20420 [Pseudopedobacter saltans]|uniref:Uncharacterized protein n=1 Tax=Pseudopedobacter saltans TaxID=151895 RepID=A0A2W5E9J9_9SPHI|nr:MAG: hypothetical protein DI598_20420 [Pseudopedobacter saltans]